MSVYLPRRADGTPKSQFWHYDFRLRPQGSRQSHRFYGSTGQASRGPARRVETRIRERAATGELISDLTINEAAWRYFAEVHADQRSAADQATNFEHLVRLIGGETLLVDVTPATVADAARRRAGEHGAWVGAVAGRKVRKPTGRLVSASTVNRQVVEPMRRILRRAESVWGVPLKLGQFKWGEIKRPEPAGRTRELGTEEEARFWAALRSDYHPIVTYFLISGHRQSDLVGLLKFKVDLSDRTARFPERKKRAPGGETVKRLSPTQAAVLARAIAVSPCEHVFTYEVRHGPAKGRRRAITRDGLRRAIATALAGAEIADFRIHDLRHTFASRLMRATGNPKAVQKALGHADLSSTMRYVHVLDDEVLDGIEMVAASRNYPGVPAGEVDKTRKKI